MPEASIDKYGDFSSRICYVRFSWCFFPVQPISSVAMISQNLPCDQFWLCVSSFVRPHGFRNGLIGCFGDCYRWAHKSVLSDTCEYIIVVCMIDSVLVHCFRHHRSLSLFFSISVTYLFDLWLCGVFQCLYVSIFRWIYFYSLVFSSCTYR